MNDNYKVLPDRIEITIHKPTNGSFVFIRDKYVKMANEGRKLHINLPTLNMVGVCTGREWLDHAKKVKKVFLIPSKPMVLYGNYVERFVKFESPKVEKEETKQLQLV